jgi:dienelactone hydrolase
MDVEGEERGRIRFIAPGLTALPLHLKLVVDGIVRDTASVQRFLLDTGIAAQHVDTNGVVGVLYTPQTRRNRGAVLVLGGSEGGIGGADVAALLASHGYVALAIAYFGVAGLPSELARIPLEGFTRALDLLEHRQGVRGAPLAIVGTSKGAEAALLVATRDTRVRAVVAYAPSAVSWSCICAAAQDPSWVEGGASVAFVPPGRDPSYQPTRGEPVRSVINYRYRVADSSVAYRAEIPVERVRGRVLLVAGTDDALWPSAWSAQRIAVRSAAQGRAAQVNVLEYAGAGHLIGKAYLPSGSTLVAGGRLDTGGSAAANARAQADSWPRVLSFLSRELARRN